MRHINTIGYKPKGWQNKADRHLQALKRCVTGTDRGVYLETAANKTWNEHKKHFERLGHYKCWFSEANASVSDYAIEHFRPKKKVYLIKSKDDYPERRTATDVNGYWWLSYELENLRLAAYKPNQLKGNYFPLESTSILATPNNNSWVKEKIILLDPCIKKDTELLSYDGVKPIEANTDPTSIDHIRARVSIKVYGLESFDRLKTARATVFQHAKNYFDEADRNWNAMNAYRGTNQVAYDLAKDGLANNCSYLASMLRPDKQFTRMVLAFLKGMNKSWIQTYVLDFASDNRYI